MAITGITVEYRTSVGHKNGYPIPVNGELVWSENVAADGTTSNAANSQDDQLNYFTIYTVADVFISIGSSPNASISSKRSFVPASTFRDFACHYGDKVSFVTA
jgi:hypothetical protein